MKRKYNRIVLTLLSLVFTLACFFGCTRGCSDNGGDRVVKPDTPTSILRDRDFSQGFNLMGMHAGTDGRNVYRVFDYNKTADAAPAWEMAQWEGKHNLVEAQEKIEGDRYTYQSGGKKFVYDSKNAVLTLAIDATQEYDAPRKTSSEGWVHILIEQNFQTVYSVEDVEKINVSLDLCLTKFDKKMTDEEFDPNLHNAQLLWYITLTNKPPQDNPADEDGYPVNGVDGDYIWFGVPIVDYTRYGEFMDAGLSYDIGTKHWICSVDSAEYLDRPVTVGVRNSFEYDIVPMFKKTLEEVQAKGGMRNCKYENLYVTYMNFGWEVPGIFDVSADIYDIGIEAVTK